MEKETCETGFTYRQTKVNHVGYIPICVTGILNEL